VVQGSEQAAEQAAESDAVQRVASVETLKQCVKAYSRGERAYRAGLLEAGRLADIYVHQRLTLGDKRGVAVQTLEGQLGIFEEIDLRVQYPPRPHVLARVARGLHKTQDRHAHRPTNPGHLD
jgi:hypothetical protein